MKVVKSTTTSRKACVSTAIQAVEADNVNAENREWIHDFINIRWCGNIFLLNEIN